MTILAWHNDPALKAETVARMRAHAAADEFVQGTYATVDGDSIWLRGCFHGCLTVEKIAVERGLPLRRAALWMQGESYHEHAERLWGIPRQLGQLLDSFFEELPSDYAGRWAVAVTEAIPVGADLSLVAARMIHDLMIDPQHGVRQHTIEGSAQRAAVDTVAELYAKILDGETVDRGEWVKARRAAHAAAAAYAAYDAAAAAAHRRWRADQLMGHIANAPIAP